MKLLTRALVVEIKYLIPLNDNGSNINNSLLLSSDKTFKDFKSAVADILGIPPKEVQAAYKEVQHSPMATHSSGMQCNILSSFRV